MPTNVLVFSFTLILCAIFLTQGEELIVNDSPPSIECKNASTCIINCIAANSCYQSQLHCHRTSPQACIINLFGILSGQEATIHTHISPLIFINGTGDDSGKTMTIYAHERLGTKLYINDYTVNGFESATIFSPVGEGSLLFMKCNCQKVDIYDDWTTEIFQQPIGHQAYRGSTLQNIFDTTNAAGVSRSDNNYIGLNQAYRAPILLNSDDCQDFNGLGAPRPWQSINWNGHNHGHWHIYSYQYDSFTGSVINATADIAPYGGITEYDIILLATRADTNMFDLTLFADQLNQNGPNIYAETNSWYGLTKTKIYAKQANSVTVYCYDGGDCHYLMVECPDNQQNNINSCKIYCDSTIDPEYSNNWVVNDPTWMDTQSSIDKATTECYNMNIYTTNGYCRDAAVICTGNTCVFDTDGNNSVKIYCGYGQNTDYCTLNDNLALTNFGTGTCNNGYDSEMACDAIVEDPIPKISNYTRQCDVFPTDIMSLIESLTMDPTIDPTHIPSFNPTKNPSFNPSQSPTNNPSNPTVNPTLSPSNPTQSPTNNPSNPTQIPTNNPSFNPSQSPTNNPSNPTTNPSFNPSFNPTFNPTHIPSFNPSEFTQSPSALPTKHEDIDGQISEYLTTQFAEGKAGNVAIDTWFEKYLIFIIIGSSMLLCLALVCVFGYISLRKRKNNIQNVELVQVTGIDTDIISTNTSIDMDDSALKMWLNNLGLMKYYSLFVEQGFDSNVSMLHELKDENLKEMGIKKMADRLLIIKALNAHKMNGLNGQAIGIQSNVDSDVVIEGSEQQMIQNVNSEEKWDNNSVSENMYNNSDSERMYNTAGNVTYGSNTTGGV